MAYLINTSNIAATTVNLAQGRVQLEPLTYCELHDIDIEKARKFYNSAELNLYVAETDKELNLILNPDKNNQKDENTDAENTVSNSIATADPLDPVDSPDPTDQVENQNQVASDLVENTADVPVVPITVSENVPVDPVEEPIKTEENDQNQKEALKKQIISHVELYKQQRNLIALKELAAKLGIPFMHNISIEKLANRIIQSLDK